SADGRDLIVEAISGESVPEMPAQFKASYPGYGDELPEYVLIPDIDEQTEECGAKDGCEQLGVRSFLGIPMHLDSGTARLPIVPRTQNQSSEEAVVVGRRVADHISLAISHQRLAAEERRAAEARERASSLEERVQVLRDQLETSLGYRRVIGDAQSWKD